MAFIEARGIGYRAVVRLPGGKRATATFDTKAEAAAWAGRLEGRKRRGEISGGSSITVGELFEEYEDVASKTDTGKWNVLRLRKWLLDPLAEIPLGKIVTHDINQWIERRGKSVSEATVNRELNLMSGAFNWGIKTRQWMATNPCHGAIRPPKTRPRNKPLLTPEQVAAIRTSTGYDRDPTLATTTARVGACFLLSRETGARSGELLRVRPEDYWRDKQTLHIAAREQGGRKGGQSGRSVLDPSRNVPLTGEAMRVLDQLLATMPKDQPYIVGVSDASRDSIWRKAIKQAGLQDIHFHDMKHEAATRLSRFLDVLELSHAIGTKDIRLLRDTYYVSDASRAAARLPKQLE